MKPPRVALWLLRRFGARYRNEALAGDLIEEYRARESRIWVWVQVLRVIASCAGPRRLSKYWHEYRAILGFLLLMAGFRSAWADWVYVPTGSMNPTVLEGDRLLIDKHVYGLRVPFTLVHLTPGDEPRRGDIVTLDSPADGTLLLKRVVAVPGDTVALEDDHLIVNGVSAEYGPGNPRELRELVAATRRSAPEVFRETGEGPAHDILRLPGRWAPSTYGPVVVPKEMYFVLGDNRDNSEDSRYIGFVPRRDIIGRAIRILFSLDPDRHDLPRAGRLLEPLR
ncbi:MAG: signal peptidase I [Steroidobacteraceae bacterium]